MARRAALVIRIGKSVIGLGLVVLAVSLSVPVHAGQPNPPGQAGGVAAELAALQQQVTALTALVDSLQSQVTALQTATANVQALNPFLSMKQPGDAGYEYATAVLTGLNLQIVNGAPNTAAPLRVSMGHANGLGNLIIGYNASRPATLGPEDRSGSHYLVIGDLHNYGNASAPGGSSVGLVAGQYNNGTNNYSSVLGGFQNTASGTFSNVLGGYSNTASGDLSSVSGGGFNLAGGQQSSVSGGGNNAASGQLSSVSGGEYNAASGKSSSVLGGYYLSLSTDYGTIPSLP